MSTVSKITDFQTTQFTSEEVPLQNLFDKQKAYFATDVTKTYEWRVDQLDRLIRMLKDNYERFANASRDDLRLRRRRISSKCRRPSRPPNSRNRSSRSG